MLVSLAVLLLSLCVPLLRQVHMIPLIAAVWLLATMLYMVSYAQRVEPTEGLTEEPLVLTVQVMDTENTTVLQVQEGALPTGTRLLFYPNNPEIMPGKYDCFQSEFVLKPYTDKTELSGLMRRSGGVWLVVQELDTARMAATLSPGDVPKTAVLDTIRQRLVTDMSRSLDGDTGALVTGVCYGADQSLSAETTAAFRACGLSHLLAVSGLHMTVLVQAVIWVLSRLHVCRWLRCLIASAGLLFFMGIVGLSASVVRAGVVCLIVMCGRCLRRQADTRNSLGLALLILLGADPFAAYDVGLLLSFSATYGLLCFAGPLQETMAQVWRPKRLSGLYDSAVSIISLSISATVATLPILALCFGEVSLMAVPTNLVTSFPATGILLFGCASSLCEVLRLTFLSQPLRLVAGLCAKYVLWVCEKFSDFSLATVALDAAFLLLWVVGSCVVLFCGWHILGTYGRRALYGFCVVVLCAGLLLHRGSLYSVLRVQRVTDEKAPATAVAYQGSVVLVISPQSTAQLYHTRDMLQTLGEGRVDAVFILGGKEPALSCLPDILGGYMTDNTHVLYTDLSWNPPVDGVELTGAAKLGDVVKAYQKDSVLYLAYEDYTLAFSSAVSEIEGVQAVFGTQKAGALLYETDGSVPLSSVAEMVAFQNEEWYQEEDGYVVFGTGTQAASEN